MSKRRANDNDVNDDKPDPKRVKSDPSQEFKQLLQHDSQVEMVGFESGMLTPFATMDYLESCHPPLPAQWFSRFKILVNYIAQHFTDEQRTRDEQYKCVEYIQSMFSKLTDLVQHEDCSEQEQIELKLCLDAWLSSFAIRYYHPWPRLHKSHVYESIHECPTSWQQAWNEHAVTARLVHVISDDHKRVSAAIRLINNRDLTSTLVQEKLIQLLNAIFVKNDVSCFETFMTKILHPTFRVYIFFLYQYVIDIETWNKWFPVVFAHMTVEYEFETWIFKLNGRLCDVEDTRRKGQLPRVLIRHAHDILAVMKSASCEIDRSYVQRIVRVLSETSDPQLYSLAHAAICARIRRKIAYQYSDEIRAWFDLYMKADVLLQQPTFEIALAYKNGCKKQLQHFGPHMRSLRLKSKSSPDKFHSHLYDLLSCDPRSVGPDCAYMLDGVQQVPIQSDVNLWIHIFRNVKLFSGHWFEAIRAIPKQVEECVYAYMPRELACEIASMI
jgi:hypothetical protein